jgi:hypothetical protein
LVDVNGVVGGYRAAHKHNREVGRESSDNARRIHAAHKRHRDVEHGADQIGSAGRDGHDRCCTVADRQGDQTELVYRSCDEQLDRCFIVGHQHQPRRRPRQRCYCAHNG